MVLVNADNLDLRMWDYQVQEFARLFEVVRYDQVGIGKTRQEGERPAPPRSLEGQREYLADMEAIAEEQGFPTNHGDLRALLDHLGVGRAHLLGLGIVANTVIDFALEYPERVSALVLATIAHVQGNETSVERLVEQWFGRTPESILKENLAKVRPAAEAMLRTGDATPFIDAMLDDPSYAPSREPARRKLRQLLTDNADAILSPQGRRAAPDFSTAGRLREIEAPVLVVHGEKVPQPAELQLVGETARLLERNIPGALRVPFPGAGRMVNMDQPEEFNRVVLGFLESVRATRDNNLGG